MKKSVRCLILALLLTSLAAAQKLTPGPTPLCSSPPKVPYTNWVQAGFDPCLDYFNPYEFILNPSNVSNVVLNWSQHVGGSPEWALQPAIVDGVAYVANSSDGGFGTDVYAFNASNGAPIWTFVASDIYLSVPAVADGFVYVNGTVNMYALNAANGAPVWSIPHQFGHPSPTVVDGVVYVVLGSFTTYALDGRTGATIWKRGIASIGNNIYSQPAVANGIVYQTVTHVDDPNRYGIYALNARTGEILWAQRVGAKGASGATVANGAVYVPADDGTLYALDALNGALIWHQPLSGGLAAAGGVIYVATGNAISALNAKDGSLKWNFALEGAFFPAVANGVVYATAGYPNLSAIALDANTGALLWQHATTCGVDSATAVNGTLYLATAGTPEAGEPASNSDDCHSLLAFRLPN